jgi:hypothetical protein
MYGPCLETNLTPKIWSYTTRFSRCQDGVADNLSKLTLIHSLILSPYNYVMTQATSLAFPDPGRKCTKGSIIPEGTVMAIERMLCVPLKFTKGRDRQSVV